MYSKLIPISDIKPNPNNPRIIKDMKFKQLVQSIKDFPEMLELRPVIVNDDTVVLKMRRNLQENYICCSVFTVEMTI